ncbi:hypothetical protein Dvina_01575 [Dactylosporangium vinaceum]|uniref:Glycoside hydrolase family 26 protein n=1 Tax=Dactylosporangium vinaceum TaxID=53362 RepID=A0ABV5MLJ3_9ACTN|nr:glycosyl hydrolase [Dactylosporangium vinaceum]UAB96944.1 hypothetical protein Dvina_01575 [Dactylosporangium vinaceum]
MLTALVRSVLAVLLSAAVVVAVAAGAVGSGDGRLQQVGKWPFLGAYTGAGQVGVDRLPGWEAWAGVPSRFGADFAPADSWSLIEGGDWQLRPWADSGRRLIFSVPLFPKGQGSLAGCAAGDYDGHWSRLGRNLVEYRLAHTIVRPGWEFNGDWYPWASAGREAQFAACFRHVVDAMRAVAGQRFEFVWNPVLGSAYAAAEPAYPGDAYVDYVGVDVYDMSWTPGTYPQAAHEAVWGTTLEGGQGLRHWLEFATAHGKRFAVPEWGLSRRADGHGGGDNPYFVERMLSFLAGPGVRPAFAMYFDVAVPLDDGSVNQHRISAQPPVFPQAAASFRAIVG